MSVLKHIANLKAKIREIPDWPQKGVSFKDITPLLEDAAGFRRVVNSLVKPFRGAGIKKVVGIDARGFLLAGPVAYKLGAGLVIVRKKGKLPYKTIRSSYELEYGSNTLEIHQGAIKKGEKVLIIDDVLATGGTAQATARLVEKSRGKIAALVFLSDLLYLKGKEKLKDYKVFSLVSFEK